MAIINFINPQNIVIVSLVDGDEYVKMVPSSVWGNDRQRGMLPSKFNGAEKHHQYQLS